MILRKVMVGGAGRSTAAVVALAVLLCAGCGKKSASTADEPGPAAAAAPATTPGAPLGPEGEINAALDRKDYDAAMALLLRLKQSANTDEKQVQYMGVAQNVKMRLIEVEATEPKAAEALTIIRSMTLGR